MCHQHQAHPSGTRKHTLEFLLFSKSQFKENRGLRCKGKESDVDHNDHCIVTFELYYAVCFSLPIESHHQALRYEGKLHTCIIFPFGSYCLMMSVLQVSRNMQHNTFCNLPYEDCCDRRYCPNLRICITRGMSHLKYILCKLNVADITYEYEIAF